MKKTTAFIMAILMCAGAFSCSDKKKEAETKTITVEKLADAAYKKGTVEIPDELMQIYNMTPCNNGEKLLIMGAADVTPAFYLADKSLQNFERFEIPDFDIGEYYNVDMSSDGNIVTLVIHEDGKVMLNVYSIEGALVSSNEVSGLYDIMSTENVYLGDFVSNGETVVAEIEGAYHVMGIDGSYIGEIPTETETGTFEAVGKDSSENIVCAVRCGENQLMLCPLNGKTAKYEDTDIIYNLPETIVGIIVPGMGEYSMYLNSRTTIYGVKSESGEAVPLFSISDSDLNPNAVNDYFFDTEGCLVIPDTDYAAFTVKLRRYVPCDPSELENIPVITIGSDYSPFITMEQRIEEINESQSEYRIEWKNYDNYNTDSDYSLGFSQFQQDMLSGSLPDIVLLDGKGCYQGLNVVKKEGVFCNLYDFMEGDSELNRDNLVPNVISLAETDGKLYNLPASFNISSLAAKTKFAEGLENQTIDEYVDTIRNLPEGMDVISGTNYINDAKYMRNYQFDLHSFVDYEKAVCHFDDPQFVKFLEYCNEAPFEAEQIDMSNMTQKEYSEWEYNMNTRIRDDKAMYVEFQMGSFDSFYEFKEGTMGGEDFTLTGYPTYNGKGTAINFESVPHSFSIPECSKNKELAWGVVKQFVSDDYYENYHQLNGFPITESGLAIMAENTLQPHTYPDTDYTGKYYYPSFDRPVEIGLPTQEDIDEMYDIIRSVDTMRTTYSYMPAVWEIVSEEIDCFFNGECTAEECADRVQNRASIALAEQS
ncbi:MAG: hypothetical protein E7497_03100 [Ruminococcus sp.]|nr:hypothetical protein [Ruminococcus sp.]